MAAESCWMCATSGVGDAARARREGGGGGGGGGAASFATGVGVRGANLAGGRATQAGEELGRLAAPTVGMLAEELGEPFFAQARGAVGRGVAREEGQRDGR